MSSPTPRCHPLQRRHHIGPEDQDCCRPDQATARQRPVQNSDWPIPRPATRPAASTSRIQPAPKRSSTLSDPTIQAFCQPRPPYQTTTRPGNEELRLGKVGPRRRCPDQIVDRYPVHLREWQQLRLGRRCPHLQPSRYDCFGARITLPPACPPTSWASATPVARPTSSCPACSHPLA
jgi:hypothetical protein